MGKWASKWLEMRSQIHRFYKIMRGGGGFNPLSYSPPPLPRGFCRSVQDFSFQCPPATTSLGPALIGRRLTPSRVIRVITLSLLSRISKLLPKISGGRSHFSLKFWASLNPVYTYICYYQIAAFQKAGTCLDAQQSMAKQPIKGCVSNQNRTCGKTVSEKSE